MLKPYYKNEKLDRRCRELRVTGALISFNTGLPEWRFSKILNGRLEPNDKEKQLLAKALACKVTDLFQK
ncbi:MAG: hypothetical protein HQK83_14890 [Fibrobacteria bacterium]|nr:hypothetical protein [Fibrobacteria bacterium]